MVYLVFLWYSTLGSWVLKINYIFDHFLKIMDLFNLYRTYVTHISFSMFWRCFSLIFRLNSNKNTLNSFLYSILQAAKAAKTVKYGSNVDGISTCDPEQYAKRFIEFIEKAIEWRTNITNNYYYLNYGKKWTSLIFIICFLQ